MTIQKETKNKFMNIRTGVNSVLLGSILLVLLLAASCAPASVGGVGDSSSAPGVATDLATDATSVDNNSFFLQWNAPAETGTKSDGTALRPDEVGYRIYYVVGTADQTTAPSAESIRQDANVTSQDVRGNTSTRILGLESGTLYFVTITSFNSSSLTQTETTSDEVIRATTSVDAENLSGTLVYDQYQFIVGISNSIVPTDTPSIPNTDSSGVQILYRLEKKDGTIFDPEPTINESTGVVAINSISNAGTSSYTVRASAAGYNTQNAILTIVIVEASLVGALSYDQDLEFSVGIDETIRPSTVPTVSNPDSDVEVSYELIKGEGTAFTPEPTIDEKTGFITINSITNTGTSSYTVRASAIGHNPQEVELSIVIFVAIDFEGSLTYGEGNEFPAGTRQTITPTDTPTIPNADGSVQIRYTLVKESGDEFTPEPTIAEDSGIVTINSISNAGTSTYSVRALAKGYTTQRKELIISIIAGDLEGIISYDQATYSFSAGTRQTIAPKDIPTAPDSGSAQIIYELVKGAGDDFDPEPTVDSNGIIMINSISNAGTSSYTVRASAVGYNAKEAVLSIMITAADLEGSLSYDEVAYEFAARTAQTIGTSTVPSIPVGNSINSQITYELVKGEGTTFTPEPTVDESGVIIINSISNAGTSAYTVRALAEGYNAQEAELSITITAVDFENPLIYDKEIYEFPVGIGGAIGTLSTPNVSETYELIKGEGDIFDPEPAINEFGAITVSSSTNRGTSAYTVQVSAEGYNSQQVELTITVTDKEFVGTLRYDAVHSFSVSTAGTISPTRVISLLTSDVGNLQIKYELIKGEGDTFDPEPSIDESTGIVTVNAISNLGTSSYTVRASAENYNMQEVEFTITVANKEFTGILSYGDPPDFLAGNDETINPIGVPSVLTSDEGTVQIMYELIKGEGDTFDPEPTVNENGIISINSIANEGTSTYTVRASATEYKAQGVEITITIINKEFTGEALAYAEEDLSVLVAYNTSITPTNTPTLLTGDVDNVEVTYALVKGDGDNFTPEPSIDENGVITINSSRAGTSSYLVQVSALGYSTQELEISIVVKKAENILRTYYSDVDETINAPAGFGQAVKEEESSAFAFAGDDVIITTEGLVSDETYTIHFGPEKDIYTSGSYEQEATDGTIAILKSDLETNSFPFTDGAAIGIGGPGIEIILHMASYSPSNIYNHQDLQAMKRDLSRAYKLERDIVFSPVTDSTGMAASNYEAVGDGVNPFTGSLDGAGNSITGVEIVSSESYQGLFGVMEASTFNETAAQNLILKNFKVTGNAYVGSLAGFVKRGAVRDISMEVDAPDTGKVEVSGSIDEGGTIYGFGGGLIGRAGADSVGTESLLVQVQNINSAVAVSGTGTGSGQIGGLIGGIRDNVVLTGSYATGAVVGAAADVGGLIGHNDGGTVSGYATGDVMGTSTNSDIGGLVGRSSNDGSVTGYATGNVSGRNFIGGLVGRSIGGTVTGYYATGSVTGAVGVGGLVGNNEGSTVTGYARGVVSGTDFAGGLVGLNDHGNAISGYARNIVRRSAGTGLGLGKTVGLNEAGAGTVTAISIYSSELENFLYDGTTGTSALTGTNGRDGSSVTVDSSTTQDAFADLAFGNSIGAWKWVGDGRWPALNIGDNLKTTGDQPTSP